MRGYCVKLFKRLNRETDNGLRFEFSDIFVHKGDYWESQRNGIDPLDRERKHSMKLPFLNKSLKLIIFFPRALLEKRKK